MVVRFNFGTEGATAPARYTLDFGEAFDDSRGYGWVQQSDLTSPIDLVPNGRDRRLSIDPLQDTFIHMQFPANNPNSTAVKTPAAWQYNIDNGTYRVTVGVGDSAFFDSNNTINAEGINLVSGFVPEPNNSFQIATETVTVDDGQLTIDAIGGFNTKLNFIEIAPVTDTKINFGLANTPAPPDYINDFGAAFSEDRGYGWVTQDSAGNDSPVPLDVALNGRDRNANDNNINDSLIHMQFPQDIPNSNSVKTPAAWEYTLPNGTYRVTARVGDPIYTDSRHRINVEGTNIIPNFRPTEERKYTTATRVVEVNDGRLTVDAIGGDNTKLNYLRISDIRDIRVNFGPEDFTDITEDYYRDSGAAYSSTRGYGWVREDSLGNGNATPLDVGVNSRVRGLSDNPFEDTLIHMQYPEDADNPSAERTSAAWEYAIPDGRYEVTVGVGDTAFTDSEHVINVEGIEAISGFTPSSGDLFETATTIVDVNDGRLTIDAIGGENTKINFIEISSVE